MTEDNSRITYMVMDTNEINVDLIPGRFFLTFFRNQISPRIPNKIRESDGEMNNKGWYYLSIMDFLRSQHVIIWIW